MWQEGQSWTCSHCGRECVIQRNVPMDLTTHKRHSCEAYKKHIKANPRTSLSETFSSHSEDRSGKLVQVPYAHCGTWVRKKWRDEFSRYLTDDVYHANKNMIKYLQSQIPMSELFIVHDKTVFEYRTEVKRGVWGL